MWICAWIFKLAISSGVNSVVAAQHDHVAVFDGYEVQTHGNLHAHLMLRGANHAPNYSITHLEEVKHHMEKHLILAWVGRKQRLFFYN